MEVPDNATCSMGVSMGTSGFYAVVSLVPNYDYRRADEPRQALFIGRVKVWSELDALIEEYSVRACLIAPRPEPHLVQKWFNGYRDAIPQVIHYTNDGLSEPEWDREGRRVTVDRTYALNSAFEEIKSQLW